MFFFSNTGIPVAAVGIDVDFALDVAIDIDFAALMLILLLMPLLLLLVVAANCCCRL